MQIAWRALHAHLSSGLSRKSPPTRCGRLTASRRASNARRAVPTSCGRSRQTSRLDDRRLDCGIDILTQQAIEDFSGYPTQYDPQPGHGPLKAVPRCGADNEVVAVDLIEQASEVIGKPAGLSSG